MSGYLGIDGKARSIVGGYIGVDNKARTIAAIYIGDENGKAKLVFQEGTKGLEYTYNNVYGTYYVTGYTGEKTNIVIPSKHNKRKVTEIRNSAFYGKDITSIKIPASVSYIGQEAFCACDKLTSVTFGKGSELRGIYDNAFEQCVNLKSIVLPASISYLGGTPFQSCYALENLAIEDGGRYYYSAGNCIIKTESKELVIGCNNSKIPADANIKSIGEDAFSWCARLTSVEIPSGVESIGIRSFYHCTNLLIVTIPKSVTHIGLRAFSNCSKLSYIKYDGTIDEWFAISRESYWDEDTPSHFGVECTDGFIQGNI